MYSVLKNSNIKFYCGTCCQFTRNLNGVTRIHPFDKKFLKHQLKLPQDQLINSHQYIFRNATTNKGSSVAIKQYKSSRKYTHIWKLERLAGWSLIMLIPIAFAIESKEIEMTLATVALLHTYWGCQSMCSDYLRSSVVGKFLPIVVRLAIVIISISSLAGAYQLVYNDVGIVNMIKKFWGIRGPDFVAPK